MPPAMSCPGLAPSHQHCIMCTHNISQQASQRRASHAERAVRPPATQFRRSCCGPPGRHRCADQASHWHAFSSAIGSQGRGQATRLKGCERRGMRDTNAAAQAQIPPWTAHTAPAPFKPQPGGLCYSMTACRESGGPNLCTQKSLSQVRINDAYAVQPTPARQQLLRHLQASLIAVYGSETRTALWCRMVAKTNSTAL